VGLRDRHPLPPMLVHAGFGGRLLQRAHRSGSIAGRLTPEYDLGLRSALIGPRRRARRRPDALLASAGLKVREHSVASSPIDARRGTTRLGRANEVLIRNTGAHRYTSI